LDCRVVLVQHWNNESIQSVTSKSKNKHSRSHEGGIKLSAVQL